MPRRHLLAHVAALLLGASILPAQQQSLRTSWSAALAEFRGQLGRRLTLVCPEAGQLADVWGTDSYTDDTPVCPAAVHAGLITTAAGGVVTVALEAGRSSYDGSTKNGVTSRPFGPWHGSYSFLRAEDAGRLEWSTTAHGLTPALGRTVALECPAAGGTSAAAYGTDVYSDDSSICTAAVHAGVITTSAGGRVVLRATGPQAAFAGSARNGVTTLAYGHWPNGFRFEPAEVATGRPTAARATVRPAVPARTTAGRDRAAAASGSGNVVRVCRVFNSGALYCRSTESLLANELQGTSREQLQASFAAIYRTQQLDPSANGLVDCGSNTWTATGQSEGATPQAGDIQGMLDSCGSQLGARMPGRGVGGMLGGPGGGKGWGGRAGGGTSCSSGGANPKAGTPGGYLANLVTGRTDNEAREQVEQDRAGVTERLKGKAETLSYTQLRDQYRATAKESEGETKARLEQLAEVADEMAREEKAKNSGGTRGTDGNIHRPGVDGDACAEVQQQVTALMEECGRNGWTSYQCMKMKSCGDPALIQPVQSTDGTVGLCGEVEIVGGEAKIRQALMMQCEARSKPGPDGATGCGDWRSEATTSQAKRVCGSPIALVTESCFEASGGQVGFMTMQRSLQDVLNTAHAKVGGPRITIGGPNPRGPGGPRNGPRDGMTAPTPPVRP